MENKKLDEVQEKIKSKQVFLIKEGVRLTLEKLNELDKMRNYIQDQQKILKHDLYDLKDGRLDKILERQSLNTEAVKVSVITVSKVASAVNPTSPWYEDYELKVSRPDGVESCKINNSTTKTHAGGSYKLNDGSMKYL